ncbi:hypothetical protein Taro_015850 [Colocasia esculenta]|uniref:Cyclin-like domain-containing protein n=1 Tax=Colocasia esculenta TaxID=4460 RepID=A0A843UIP3_COLES|nr:hypothetical protein [Colocasia esculenta]
MGEARGAAMWRVRCPYCTGSQGRCAATASGRWVTECCSCGRVVEERQVQDHQLFLLRAHDNPLCLVTPDLSAAPAPAPPADREEVDGGVEEADARRPRNRGGGAGGEAGGGGDEDPFEPTGFITAFSTWSLEPAPVFARSSYAFAGHLAELERALDPHPSSATPPPPAPSPAVDSSGPLVSVDLLRAYLQIIDVSSILDLDHDIADHAFQLFRDCSSTTCLRNRNIEALATAALVQAIREAQEPRTLQEISTAANLPQKEIGKYIKVLGESLKLSQPINSNSIAVHMPRFCTLLQLNKSAQDLAAHIGEVVINKCFCTRRNPISISAAAIYLACQLEDKRKTQAEICKVTGLTEVTLRKVYKELLENFDDLLPPNYTPAVPPEKAFPMTAISSGRSSANKLETAEVAPSNAQQDKEKQPELKPSKPEIPEPDSLVRGKGVENKSNFGGTSTAPLNIRVLNQAAFFGSCMRPDGDKGERGTNVNEVKLPPNPPQKLDRAVKSSNSFQRAAQAPGPLPSDGYLTMRMFQMRPVAQGATQLPLPSRQLQAGSDVASGQKITSKHVNNDQADAPPSPD